MTPLATVLALGISVCAIFGTTSESAELRKFSNEIYEESAFRTNTKLTHLHNKKQNILRKYEMTRWKRDVDDPCEFFKLQDGKNIITNPKINSSAATYSSNTTCFTLIEALPSTVIELTFLDKFEMEESMPKCEHDYLEIRDGKFGYATPMHKFCGKSFPPTITSRSPFMWLKFHSDETLEYYGFTIEVGFPLKPSQNNIPESCYITAPLTYGVFGVIGSYTEEYKRCKEQSVGPLDIQWKIETNPGTRIYLNFTEFKLAQPNDCEHNVVQVFGSEPNFDHELKSFCSSVATLVTTNTEIKENGPTNIMYVRLFTTDRSSNFTAEFTGFRTLEMDEKCDVNNEFDCLDSTCINIGLKCDKKHSNCMLKTDEDPELCKTETESLLEKPESRNILIILCLILTGICSVLFFKCARKVYLDQKQIKENQAKSCEERLDKLTDDEFMLDPGILTREHGPGSLDRDNQNNEMVKQQRNRRKSTSSIESDLLDINGDWPEHQLIPSQETRTDREESVREDLPKPKRDFSRKEESLRSIKSSKEEEQKIKHVAIEVPDALEAACQTRESLFQTEPVTSSGTTPSSNGQTYSDGTIARLSPTVAATSEITIELMRQPHQSSQSQDRRPMSSETTRSAPDVIIVSKPI